MESKQATIGAISSGTDDSELLIKSFLAKLKELDPKKYEKEEKEFRILLYTYLYEELWLVMQNYEPEGCFFGEYATNKLEYGYWPIEESEE